MFMTNPLVPNLDVNIPDDGLTIGQASEATGVSIEALRYYERESLMLDATPRDGVGRRRFGTRDVAWIAGVVMLRETGMSIADIRVIAHLSRREGTEGERLEFFRRQGRLVLAAAPSGRPDPQQLVRKAVHMRWKIIRIYRRVLSRFPNSCQIRAYRTEARRGEWAAPCRRSPYLVLTGSTAAVSPGPSTCRCASVGPS